VKVNTRKEIKMQEKKLIVMPEIKPQFLSLEQIYAELNAWYERSECEEVYDNIHVAMHAIEDAICAEKKFLESYYDRMQERRDAGIEAAHEFRNA
jgi:hypothetical protein